MTFVLCPLIFYGLTVVLTDLCAGSNFVLAWRIPGMGVPGGLPSMGSHRVGHDRSDLAAAAACSFPVAAEACVQYYLFN